MLKHFLKLTKKKSIVTLGRTRGSVCVRQVAPKTDDSLSSLTNAQESETHNDVVHCRKTAGTKPPRLCFFL